MLKKQEKRKYQVPKGAGIRKGQLWCTAWSLLTHLLQCHEESSSNMMVLVPVLPSNIRWGAKWAKLPKSPVKILWNGNINFPWIFKSWWSQKKQKTKKQKQKAYLLTPTQANISYLNNQSCPCKLSSIFVSQTPLNHSGSCNMILLHNSISIAPNGCRAVSHLKVNNDWAQCKWKLNYSRKYSIGLLKTQGVKWHWWINNIG